MNNLIKLWDSLHPQLFVLLVNTAWQVALLAMLIFLSIFLLKIKSAAMRYGLWLVVVFSPVFLPLLNLSAPVVNIHLFQHQPGQIVYEETIPKGFNPAKNGKYPTVISVPDEFSDSKPDTIQKSRSIKKQPGGSTSVSRPTSNAKSESRFVLPISLKEILLLP